MKSNEGGFTLVELIIIITLTALLSTVVFGFLINYWSFGYKLEADLNTITTRLNAVDFLRESIGTSTGLINQNSIQDNNTAVPDPAIASNKYWKPIHAIPGNMTVGASGTYKPVIYYRRPSLTAAGAYIMNGNNPYEDEYIIYLSGTSKSLMLRTLVNPSATGNRLQTSCPLAIATTSCPADKILAPDLTSVDTRYFSRTGNTIDYTSIFDSSINAFIGPDFPVVEVLELKLNLAKKALLQTSNTTQNSTVIRIALRNA